MSLFVARETIKHTVSVKTDTLTVKLTKEIRPLFRNKASDITPVTFENVVHLSVVNFAAVYNKLIVNPNPHKKGYVTYLLTFSNNLCCNVDLTT